MALRSVIFLILVSLPASLASANDKLSAYQVLQQYDFPAGILPKGVSGYELNRGTGEFSTFLQETCNFKIESYELSYKSTIHGVISPGRITNLKVIHDGEEMEFSVGIGSANFLTDNFYESPKCGCGFDCNRFNAFAAASI
ncbi:hypothetical protein ES332_A11G129600v1 [Gossypium tomentosum]|uniref:Uncharacterized protein n=1 Tax=Gossypium tomentosum TaxID=34277 RepID=A0A5D2NAZ8_GOSTO|nr:hypothetical protein ES332_A11G129600v1 [Gossypium tomentosum]